MEITTSDTIHKNTDTITKHVHRVSKEQRNLLLGKTAFQEAVHALSLDPEDGFINTIHIADDWGDVDASIKTTDFKRLRKKMLGAFSLDPQTQGYQQDVVDIFQEENPSIINNPAEVNRVLKDARDMAERSIIKKGGIDVAFSIAQAMQTLWEEHKNKKLGPLVLSGEEFQLLVKRAQEVVGEEIFNDLKEQSDETIDRITKEFTRSYFFVRIRRDKSDKKIEATILIGKNAEDKDFFILPCCGGLEGRHESNCEKKLFVSTI